MEYFYTPPENISSESLDIDGDEFAHLTHVMRKKAGDTFRVVNGTGTAYDVELVELAKKNARCRILAKHAQLHEPTLDVTLAFGILKNGSNVDFMIEKCTEIGVTTFVPLFTERTIPKHARVDRWQKLALAAMKQSGRCVLPTVREATAYDQFVESTPAATKLIPHEQISTPSLRDRMKNAENRQCIICIGPEGGFTNGEIQTATRHNFTAVSLGARRLRTETAAIVSCGLVLS